MSVAMNLTIEQGTDYTNSITVTDDVGNVLDLTGYTFAGLMRRSYSSLTGFILNVSAPAPTTGVIVFGVTADDSGTFPASRYVYDIVMVSPAVPSVTSRVVEGIVTVTPGVVGAGGMSSGVITSFGATGGTGSTGSTGATGSNVLNGYTVGDLPINQPTGSIVYVSGVNGGTGGVAVYNGSAWFDVKTGLTPT